MASRSGKKEANNYNYYSLLMYAYIELHPSLEDSKTNFLTNVLGYGWAIKIGSKTKSNTVN